MNKVTNLTLKQQVYSRGYSLFIDTRIIAQNLVPTGVPSVDLLPSPFVQEISAGVNNRFTQGLVNTIDKGGSLQDANWCPG